MLHVKFLVDMDGRESIIEKNSLISNYIKMPYLQRPEGGGCGGPYSTSCGTTQQALVRAGRDSDVELA